MYVPIILLYTYDTIICVIIEKVNEIVMNEFNIIHEFFVEGKDRHASHVLLHVTEPSTPEEEHRKGYFFALVEMNYASPEQVEHMQHIIDDLESGYYEGEDEGPDGKSAFEAALEYLNRRSDQVLSKSNNVHCIVGVLRGKTLTFAYHGAPQALLYYTSRSGELQSVDVLADAGENTSDQLFSSLLDGEVNPGDWFYISTPGVHAHFPGSRLGNLITSRTMSSCTSYIENILKDMREDTSFGGLFLQPIDTKKQEPPTKKKRKKQGSVASLQKLMQAEKSTAQTLSPPVFGSLREKFTKKDAKKSSTRTKKQTSKSTSPKSSQKDQNDLLGKILVSVGEMVVRIGVHLYRSSIWLGKGVWKLFIVLLILATNKNNGRKHMLNQMKDKLQSLRLQFSSLTILSKVLFLATIVLSIIFISSIGVLRMKEKQNILHQALTSKVEAIEEQLENAEASILYGNTDKAFDMLQTAKQSIESLPADQKDVEEIKTRLTGLLDEQFRKIQKVTLVETTAIADLSEKQVTISGLEKIDNSLLAYGAENQTLYTITIATGEVREQIHDTLGTFAGASVPKENDEAIFFATNNTVASYDKESTALSPKDISYPVDNVKMIGPYIYNTRLYAVDTANNQIYKHNKTSTGYDKGAAWLKDSDDRLANATTLAVDGSIYVGREDGSIVKYSKGVEESFTINNLEPALASAIELWTHNNVDYLYILEPANQRIVKVSKSGRLVKQYKHDDWANPAGFVVDAEGDTIYVVDSGKIYSFGDK